MKKLFLIMVIGFFSMNLLSYAQCPDPAPTWHRAINQPVYKWYWDGDLNGAHFRGHDYQDIDNAQAKTIVRESIEWAVSMWLRAVNFNGPVIENMDSTYDIDSAGFVISFQALKGHQGGSTPNSTSIEMANQVFWTDIISVADSGNAYDFKTALLHEFGHLFLGLGHSGDTNSVMYPILDIRPVMRHISTCDRDVLLSFYISQYVNVTVDQKLSNGYIFSVGRLRKWDSNNSQWGNLFNPGTSFYFLLSSTQVIQGDQTIIQNEKYNNWNNYPDVTNHHSFVIDTTTTRFTSHFKPTNSGITIKTSLDGTSFSGGSIQFKDPWLIDYPDPLYGNNLRNQGISAPFKTRNSPFSPDYSTSYNGDVYQGVFLGQGSPNWSPPYYTVKAASQQTININGTDHIFFFQNWEASPSGSATFQNANATETPVVFNNAGATVSANYSNSTVSMNTTIPAGTYNIAGNLTVLSGVTLTVNSGAILNFPSGSGLIVNGKLVSSGAVFSAASGNWKGITFSHAEGSSILNTTISYALSPIIIDNTTSITVSNCTINNSSFYDNNFNETAAIQVWNSTPTIESVTIEGRGDSWNGVRFADNSGGTLEYSTIENLGAGNGVVIQGGSSPIIYNNTIQHNHYHGIIVNSNGTGNPTITSNTVSYNGQNNYIGIYFANSSGEVRLNDIDHSHYGIWARYTSSITSGDVGQEGDNSITNNGFGIVATESSNLDFGLGVPAKNYYWGVCNSIYNNTTYDAYSMSGAHLYAEYNWWGQYPLNPSKFYVDGTSRLGTK